jgi:hypothetical protein
MLPIGWIRSNYSYRPSVDERGQTYPTSMPYTNLGSVKILARNHYNGRLIVKCTLRQV